MKYTAAFQPSTPPEYIKIVQCNSAQELLDLLIDELELFVPDYDYEIAGYEAFDADVDTVLEELSSTFNTDDTQSVISLTVVDQYGNILFEG